MSILLRTKQSRSSELRRFKWLLSCFSLLLLLLLLFPVAFGTMPVSAHVINSALADDYSQTDRLLPDAPVSSAYYGQAVAISTDGKTMLVSAPGENTTSGAVYIYTKATSEENWILQTKIQEPASSNTTSPSFGSALAISADGNTALIASRYAAHSGGVVYVYVRNNTSWTLQTTLSNRFSTEFGSAIALSADGNTASIGAEGSNNFSGSAFIFTRTGNLWAQVADFVPTGFAPSEQPYFGHSIALSDDGSKVVVGAPNQGAAYVYRIGGASWILQQKITNPTTDSRFGNSVGFAGDSNLLLVGASGIDGFRGAAFIYGENGNSWTQQAQLSVNNLPANTKLAQTAALSTDGTTALLGSAAKTSVYIFKKSETGWSSAQQIAPATSTSNENENFGSSLALSKNGAVAIVGAPNRAEGNNTNVGAVYIFQSLASKFVLSVNNTSSVEGRTVVFTAQLANAPGNAKVTFTVDGVAGVAPTSVTNNGTTFLYAADFAIGQHSVSAVYAGENGEPLLTTEAVGHLVTTLCDGILVTQTTDDGSGSMCGSFSRAAKNAATIGVSNPMITFALEDTTQVQLSGQANLVIPANVTIDGGTGIVLEGNNQAGDGLVLKGHNSLKGLTIKGFAGREVVLNGPRNVFTQVVILS